MMEVASGEYGDYVEKLAEAAKEPLIDDLALHSGGRTKKLQNSSNEEIQGPIQQNFFAPLLLTDSVTWFGEISLLWHNAKTLWPFWKCSFSICQRF